MKKKYTYSGPVSSVSKICLVTGTTVELDPEDKRTRQLIKLGHLKEVVLDTGATEKKPAAPVKTKK